jgi:hypothetical protein
MEMCDQLHAPAYATPKKELLVPIIQEAGWIPEPARTLWRREKSLSLTEIELRWSSP